MSDDRLRELVTAVAEATYKAEEMDRRREEYMGPEHLAPAFRTIDYKRAFLDLAKIVNGIKKSVDDLRAYVVPAPPQHNPYLPPKPDDGEHVYWDQPTDIGGNHRCKLCGAYKGSDESKKPCEGEFKESGKMRIWAEEKFAREQT